MASEVIHHSDLMHQLVIDRATLEELGRIEVVWMYAPAHKVLGFVCKTGFLSAKKLAFNLAQLHTIGAQNILVTAPPQETDGERVNQLESLIGCEVWTDAGRRIGKITDYRFHLKTGEISDYLFTTGTLSALTDGIYCLPPYRVLSVGRRRVMIADTAVRSLSIFRDGIKQKLKKAEGAIKEDYTQVTQELRSLSQRAQTATEQAKERARLLAEQAKAKVQTLNEHIKESSQTLADQAKEKSLTLVEQVKEQAQVIREQLVDDDSDERSPTVAAPIPDSIFEEDWEIDAPAAQPEKPQTPPPPAWGTPPPDPPSAPTVHAAEDAWKQGWDNPLVMPASLSQPTTTPFTAPEIPIAPETGDIWDDIWDDDPPIAVPQGSPPSAVGADSSANSEPPPAGLPTEDDEPWV